MNLDETKRVVEVINNEIKNGAKLFTEGKTIKAKKGQIVIGAGWFLSLRTKFKYHCNYKISYEAMKDCRLKVGKGFVVVLQSVDIWQKFESILS